MIMREHEYHSMSSQLQQQVVDYQFGFQIFENEIGILVDMEFISDDWSHRPVYEIS